METTLAHKRLGPRAALLACPDCDAVQTVNERGLLARALCFRCGALLARGAPHLDRALAFALGAIPLFVAANCFPLMRMEGDGSQADATLIGAVIALHHQRMSLLATLVLLTSIVLPLLRLGGTTYLLLGLRRHRLPAATASLFRFVQALRPWTQLEILLLGMVVAYGKLATAFTMVPGVASLCLALYLGFELVAATSFDARHFWDRVASAQLPASQGRRGPW